MKELSPAKVAAVSFLFLVVLYFTGGVDFAAAAVVISSVFLFRLTSVWLFIGSFLAFSLYLVFNFLSLKLDFITDLTISSYALFAAGIASYFLQGQRGKWEITLPFMEKISISQTDLFKLGGILVFVFLVYPLTNSYLAAIIGYVVFLLVFKKFDGRYAFSIALFFLILCPFLLIGKKDKIAETSAIFTYYFLVIGTLQELVNIIRSPEKYEEEESMTQPQDLVGRVLRSERVRRMRIQEEGIKDQSIQTASYVETGKPVKIIIMVISVIFLGVAAYFFFSFIFQGKFSIKKANLIVPIGSATPTPTITITSVPPPPSPSPSSTISPASISEKELASLSASLKIMVENGTTISGLAASTAAKLKTAGFKNVEIGNAQKRDYKTWELTFKKQDHTLMEYFKKLLTIDSLIVNTATVSAKFDVVLIIGEKK